MFVELIGLLRSPDMWLAMHVNRGTDICCLWISEILQGLGPWEFNNISKLGSKATGAKVSIDSTIPPFDPKYGNLHRNLLCVHRGPVCVCARNYYGATLCTMKSRWRRSGPLNSKRRLVIPLTPVNCLFVNQSLHRCSSACLYLFLTDPNARNENFREENLDKRASYLAWCGRKHGDS